MLHNPEIDTTVNNTVESGELQDDRLTKCLSEKQREEVKEMLTKNISDLDKRIGVRKILSAAFKINDDDVALALDTLQKSYRWGNYRLDMSEFEMTTSGGEDKDYDEENNEAIMTVYANNEESFVFRNSNEGYKLLKILNPYTFFIIISNLIFGTYTIPQD